MRGLLLNAVMDVCWKTALCIDNIWDNGVEEGGLFDGRQGGNKKELSLEVQLKW